MKCATKKYVYPSFQRIATFFNVNFAQDALAHYRATAILYFAQFAGTETTMPQHREHIRMFERVVEAKLVEEMDRINLWFSGWDRSRTLLALVRPLVE